MPRAFAGRALMIGMMTAAVAVGSVPAVPFAQARDVSLAAFYGRWQGAALSESDISVHFQVTSRDLDVRVAPQDDGFIIEWTTLQRQKGSVTDPVAVNKSTAMTFVPSGKPNLWRGADAMDPLRAPFAWASIKDNTLRVQVLAVDADGGFEMQIYERSLTGNGMELRYTRLKNAEPVRTAKGLLVKIAN